MINKLKHQIRYKPSKTMKTWGLLLGFTILFVIPSSNIHRFDGVPFSSWVEYGVLLLLLPMLLNQKLRHLYAEILNAWQGRFFIVLIVLLGFGLGSKLLIHRSTIHHGFLACYRPLVAPLPNNECERSYENPFFRYQITRIDKQLDFKDNDWKLTFFNSSRFNFYPWEDGNILRERIPFSVNWEGNIDNSDGSALRLVITYSGEGYVTVNEEIFLLPPTYQDLQKIRIPLSPGIHTLRVFYIFDDDYRTGDSQPPGPRAQIYWMLRNRDNSTTVLSAPTPSFFWQMLGSLVDISIAIFAISILWGYFRILKRHSIGLAFVLILSIVFYWIDASSEQSYWVLLIFGLVYTYFSDQKGIFLFAYCSTMIVGIFRVLTDFTTIDLVNYHTAGNDWLTYESLARTILETYSLKAGESVFYWQPLIRYIKFGEHFLLGDGDFFSAAFAFGFLYFGIYFFCIRLTNLQFSTWKRKIFGSIPVIFSILLVYLQHNYIYYDSSEVPTWILLPYALTLLFISSNSRDWIVGTILLALTVITRPNHLPAVLLLFFLFLLARIFGRPDQTKKTVLFTIVLTAIMLLPLAHNLYYGGEAVLFTSGSKNPANLILPPDTLLKTFDQPETRATFVTQIRFIFYLRDNYGNILTLLAFRGLQFSYIIAIFYCIFHRQKIRWYVWGMLFVPLAYLGVHIFYQANVYYPRHIVIGHLFMGYLASYIFIMTRPLTETKVE